MTISPTGRTTRAATRVLVGLAAAAVVVPLAPGAAPAASRSPDLVVTRATVDRASVSEGSTLRVSHVVKNVGRAKARGTRTRFYLTTDPRASLTARRSSRTNPRTAPQDVRLLGERSVKALPARRSLSQGAVELTVPIGTAAGSYTVLVCADDRGQVRELVETNNCTAADRKLTVAAAPGSDDLVLQSFADTSGWPANEDLSLQMMRVFCQSVQPARAMSLGGALGGVESFLKEKAGPGALTQLAQSGQADTPKQAQELAAVGVVGNSPGLALASLMRAHGLEPGNGSHLVNLAAVATSVGLPNEALAFLDAAQTRDFRRPAMGVSQSAISMVVRGQALVMTGRPGPAEALFTAARAAEPMLSEADAGLATIEVCRGNDLRAARYVRKSRQRSQKKDTRTPAEEVVRPEPALDLGFGEVTTMRTFPMPETPAQGAAMHQQIDEMNTALHAELEAIGDERERLEDHLRATDDLRLPVEIRRRSSIEMEAVDVDDDPVVAGHDDRATDRFYQLTGMIADFFGGGSSAESYVYHDLAEEAGDACVGSPEEYRPCFVRNMNATCRPALTAAHTQWRGLMSEMETALQQHLVEYSKRVSALASNLEDEEAHQLMLLTIRSREASGYGFLVQQAWHWSRYEQMYEEECVAPLEVPVVEPGQPESVQSSGPCPPGIAAMNFVALLGPSKMKVTCEKVTQELSAEVLPLLHVFGEVSYEFRTGKLTFFAGSKGEGKLGVVEGGFKSGIYLTSDGRGEISDVGWRVGPSVSVTEGAAEYQVYEDNVDLSFVAGMRTGP